MPSREAHAPRRVPFLKPLHTLFGEFPNREIRGIALPHGYADPRAFGLPFEIKAR